MRPAVWLPAVLVAAVTAIGVTGVIDGGPSPTLSAIRTGDGQLAKQAAPYLDGVRDRVSICVLEDGDATMAGFGADARTRYEIGSITKTFTGMLLAEAIARGEVKSDDAVGEYLELGEAPIASTTLAELASHTSGLGEWGDDERDETLMRWWVEDIRGDTVHHSDLAAVLDRARADPLSTRGQYRYSNIGFALLGHALAEAADTPYPQLLQTRLLDPIGMRDSGITTEGDRNQQRGFRADGRAAPPWHLGAYAPSGSAYSTVTDLCRYASQLLAMHEQEAPDEDIDVLGDLASGTGRGWNAPAGDGESIAWKNGQTGGFTSTIAIDPDASRAVVVLTNTVNDLDPLVQALLEGPS